MTPQSVTNEFSQIGDHLLESRFSRYTYADIDEKQDRIKVKYIKDICYDGRRVWILATVWFDEKPVMIVQNAGREGRDFEARFITDAPLYKQMLQFIESLIELEEPLEDVIDPNEDRKDLTFFYCDSLENL